MKQKKYLFLLKEENLKKVNSAYMAILKTKSIVTVQHSNVGFEVLCDTENAELLFKTALFSFKTSSKITLEDAKQFSAGQLRVIDIWNSKFADAYKKRKKERTKTVLKWSDKKVKEPAPDMPYDINMVKKRLDEEIKKKKLNVEKLKPGLDVDTNRIVSSDFIKVREYFISKLKSEKLGYKIALIYYHFSPQYRKYILSDEILNMVKDILAGADKEDTCWKMFGKNSVGVVFVESSNNNGPKFTNNERNEIINEIITGLSWLVVEHPTNNLSWVYDYQYVKINVANKANKDDLDSAYDSYWRNPAIGQVNFEGHTYSADDNGIDNYKDDLREQHNSEHAIVVFVTPYGSSWHAYSSGKRYISLAEHGDNWGGWGQDELNTIIAHEMCHKYGAADEYTGSGTPCNSCGGSHGCDNIPNGNCKSCASPGEECVMDQNDLNLCQYTRAQIGWSDIFVELTTADENYAGTNDTVKLDTGTTSYTLNVPNHDDREKGNKEGYAIWAGGNLSRESIKRILIRKSEDGSYGGWKLKKVKVMHDGDVICEHTPNKWLEDNDLTYLACVYDDSYVNTLSIEVTTADVSNAGTNDDVTLKLAGKSWNLDNAGDDFERGDTNVFNLDPDTNFKVADITTITITKSSDGCYGGWKLKGLKLIVNGNTIYNNQSINKWLEDDNRIFTANI